MNRFRFIIGLIIFGLICVTVEAAAGIIFENIHVNDKIEQKLKTISESEKPIFRLGNEIYYISKFDKSSNNLTSFDRCIDDTTIRTP